MGRGWRGEGERGGQRTECERAARTQFRELRAKEHLQEQRGTVRGGTGVTVANCAHKAPGIWDLFLTLQV